jgi:hypothetical protein
VVAYTAVVICRRLVVFFNLARPHRGPSSSVWQDGMEFGERGVSGWIVRADAGHVPLQEEASVDCVVTSPLQHEYAPYRRRGRVALKGLPRPGGGWTQEIARVLKPGGRTWVNVPQSLPELGRPQPDRWSPATMWHELLLATGLLFRDWIVWRQVGADGATAWGSHLSPNAPNIRGRYELVRCSSKSAGRADGLRRTTSTRECGDRGRRTFGTSPA